MKRSIPGSKVRKPFIAHACASARAHITLADLPLKYLLRLSSCLFPCNISSSSVSSLVSVAGPVPFSARVPESRSEPISSRRPAVRRLEAAMNIFFFRHRLSTALTLSWIRGKVRFNHCRVIKLTSLKYFFTSPYSDQSSQMIPAGSKAWPQHPVPVVRTHPPRSIHYFPLLLAPSSSAMLPWTKPRVVNRSVIAVMQRYRKVSRHPPSRPQCAVCHKDMQRTTQYNPTKNDGFTKCGSQHWIVSSSSQGALSVLTVFHCAVPRVQSMVEAGQGPAR